MAPGQPFHKELKLALDVSTPSSIGIANRTGATAQAMLARGEWSGRVLAVISNAAYLIGSDDAVLWVAQEKTPLHPRVIRGSFDLRALRAGMRFWQHDTLVYFASSGREQPPVTSLQWANASVWKPVMIPTAQVAPPETVHARMLELLMALVPSDEGDSFGQLLPVLQQIATRANPTAAVPSSVYISAAMAPFIEIVHGCRERDMRRVLDAARALIGLGPGLTPGGDDFVGGLFFVAHHMNAAYPGELDWESSRLVDWLAWARSQTNAISHAILSDHARGEGVQPLHELVAALLGNRPRDEIMPSVQSMRAIGSTTGWDTLTGALTAFLLLRLHQKVRGSCPAEPTRKAHCSDHPITPPRQDGR